MNSRAVSRLAWVLWAVMALLFLLSIVFSLSRPPTIPELTANNAVWSLLFMVFATVGALIVSRRPDSAVGWIFLLTSVLHLFPSFAYDYATLGTSGSWLDIEIVAWLSVVTFPSLFALVLVFLPLLVP